MKNLSSIAAIALASSVVLLATGCDRKPAEQTAEQPAGQAMDNAVASAQTEAGELGDTLERKADQAGQAIDDATITATIKGKYLADDTLKGLAISVDTEQGMVTLSGSVQSDSAREVATQIAQSTEGVVNVDNQLTVQ